MPNRILKESICVSDSIDSLSWFEEVLFYRLIVNCDDYGRFDGRTAVIKNRLFPLKENLTYKQVAEAINNLASAGLVMPYECDGKPFLHLPSWNAHQNVRAKRSKYPEPNGKYMNVQSDDGRCMQMYANVPDIQSNPNPMRNQNTNAREANVSESVEQYIQAYPLPEKKINRHLTETAFIDCLMTKQVTEEQLIEAAKNYADKLKRLGKEEDYRFIKKPENFLKDMEYCQYLPGIYEPPKPPKPKNANNFNRFEQNDYDFAKLEEELLSN